MTHNHDPSPTFLLLGLPEAGKTTFLAAVWHVAEAADVSGALKADQYFEDIEYLNGIRDRWLAVDPTPRTRQAAEKLVTMVLRTPAGDTVRIVLPDISGESFVQYWKDRAWPRRHATIVASCAGVLLLIHPGHVYPGPRLDEVLPGLHELESASHDQMPSVSLEDTGVVPNAKLSDTRQQGPTDVEEPWDAEQSPTEIILVDLLQMVLAGRASPGPLRVALIVSAWDTLPPQEELPMNWVRRHLPLLHQFLEANDDLVEWRPFGVSAHGGDPVKDAATLRMFRRPHERIKVIADDEPIHDITLPLRWLMVR